MAAAARQSRLQAVIVRIPPPPCLNIPVVKPLYYFVFPPLAAVGRACPAVLRVMLCLHGITGNSSLKLKLHLSERRERSSL